MHPNRQFLADFVVHMPSCLHDLFCATHPLYRNRGCEGTVAQRCFLYNGGGRLSGVQPTANVSH